ncbi:tyrosine-type recombinase/integrase, partial [Alphaproteobacteria bacterium]|nr:tyrosine-type recombinase/integrase [Alphaproteobacteria bacterium]
MEVSRIPFSTKQIVTILEPCYLSSLHKDFQILTSLLVNTGMRPVEAIGLELDDIFLDHPVPHVHVRRNSTRGLKTDHSERLLPLLGVSLDAAKHMRGQNGWGKRLGKNMYATTVINRHLRNQGLV